MTKRKNACPEQLRFLDTPEGTLCYVLRRKGIKKPQPPGGQSGGCETVHPSAISGGAGGGISTGQKRLDFSPAQPGEAVPSRTTARSLPGGMCSSADRGPSAGLSAGGAPGVAFPQLKLRKMKSQWGNCHWTQGYITLNTALGRCPERLRDYVALHELVHFLHHDHGPGFYSVMDALMPDWRERRKALRGYGAALS